MIEISELSKTYGAVTALSDVSFQVWAGEIIGLLGPNGAGKTTLMKIMAGFLQPDSGSIRIGEQDAVENPSFIQKILGYLPENAPLYPELTVQSSLGFTADLRGIAGADRARAISDAVRATGLSDRLAHPIGELSKGYRQRVGLAQAILHKPKILILDEPTNGLDPTQIVEVRQLIRRLSGETTIILSTHILAEVEAICDRAVIIMNGRIRADARLSDLASTSNAVVTLIAPPPDAVQLLARIPNAVGVDALGSDGSSSTYRVRGSKGEDICPVIYDVCRANGWRLAELRSDRRTLETVFADLAQAEEGLSA